MATNISGSGDSTFGGTIQSTGIDDNATSTKLTTTSTGIDVTGTVTADGLTVEGGVARLTTSHLAFSGQVPTPSEGAAIYRPLADSVAVSTNNNQRLLIANNGDISFYEDTGTTPKFFWDASAESLGIGTSSPDSLLHIETVSGTAQIKLRKTVSGTSTIKVEDSGFLNINNVSNAGILFSANDTERMCIDSSGNVGIGTSSPSAKLDLQGASAGAEMLEITHSGASQPWKFISGESGVTNEALIINRGASGEWMRFHAGAGTTFSYDGTTRMRIDSSGNLKFDSGYGSAATAYGCRAWVNFNGTGTVAIRASGNVSSITDRGTGDYLVNFTTAMPDANYSAVRSVALPGNVLIPRGGNTSASQLNVYATTPGNTVVDPNEVHVAIFR